MPLSAELWVTWRTSRPTCMFLDRRALLLRHDLADAAREFLRVEIVFLLADLDGDVGRFVAAAFGDGEQKLEQILLQPRHDPADHTEIEQRDAVVGGDEDVPRVWVGMEEAVHQDLLEVGVKHLLGERGAIEFHPGERAQIGDFFARDELHREHARRAVVGDGGGDHEPRKFAELLAQGGEIARLLPVIELLEQALAELLEQLAELVAFPHLGVVIEEIGDVLERLEIFHHPLADLRTLDFHRDRAAVAQRGAMHLAQRRRGHRLVFEILKGFRKADAELFADDFFDFGEAERLDLILQPGERVEVSRREQLHARREELADLDEGGPELLEVGRQLVGFRRLLRRDLLLGGERFVETARLHEIGPAVFHEDPRDLAIALQMLWFQ